jgi:glutamate-5-semialdehyde dehydrogenase
MTDVRSIAERARALAPHMAEAESDRKDAALRAMAERLRCEREALVAANAHDIADAEAHGVPDTTRARLAFGPDKVDARARSLEAIAALPDPVGAIIRADRLANGIVAQRVRVPLGVILMVYEARPHVSINAGALCMKSGNTCILRGGSEAAHCNALLGRLWGDALDAAELPREAITMLSGSHDAVKALLQLDTLIDLVIPRGGKALIRAVAQHARIPVIKHYAGVCHVYVDASADPVTASRIVIDSKCLMPEVCNAVETVLVSASNPHALRRVVRDLQHAGVTVRGCNRTRAACPAVAPATEADWETEYLDTVIAVRVVPDVAAAVAHVNRYGSHHTDSIVTPDAAAAEQFCRAVDSAVVLHNASTMFCDGASLGMGAEIGISTDKLHARGPMGLEELTSYKFVLHGDGQVMGAPRTHCMP